MPFLDRNLYLLELPTWADSRNNHVSGTEAGPKSSPSRSWLSIAIGGTSEANMTKGICQTLDAFIDAV
jgi:hypothetical protein